MKGLRDYGVKEEFAHVTAVAGRAFARQGRKAPTRVGAQTRSAKARSGWGKGAIRMDMEDRSWVALLVMWGWALSYFLWLVLKKKKKK